MNSGSAYSGDLNDITAEDLHEFYKSVKPFVNPSYVTISDDDEDSEDLQRQLELYSQGRIGDLMQQRLAPNSSNPDSNPSFSHPSSIIRASSRFSSPVRESFQARNELQMVKPPLIQPSMTPKFSEHDFFQKMKEEEIQQTNTCPNPETKSSNEESEDHYTSTSSISGKKLTEMHQIMKTWLELDDEIKEVNKVLKILRQKQKDMTHYLLKDMRFYQVGYLTEGTQKLRYNVTSQKQAYKRDYIQDTLTEYLKDPKLAEKITEYLEKSRPKSTKINLKRGTCDPLKEAKKVT